VSVRVTLPVVLAVILGVARVSDPIAPELESRVTDVDPVIVDEEASVPLPLALSETAVPETAASIAMPLLAPLFLRVTVPLLVSVLVRVIAVAAEAVSVKLKLAPVEGRVPVST